MATTAQLFCPHSHIDLENGGIEAVNFHRRPAVGDYEAHEDGSLCSSDEDEEEEEEEEEDEDEDEDEDDHSNYSSYSQFYSTNGGSSSEAVEIKVHSGKIERICRICHLNLVGENEEFGAPIELGCSCKDDLGTAHKHCAETWFKIKGNKICEICNCTAGNVAGPNENTDSAQPSNESANSASEPASVPAAPEPQRFWQGNRFLNFLLACMVFAFVISWLFHFKVPS